jgi:hypothetical protein
MYRNRKLMKRIAIVIAAIMIGGVVAAAFVPFIA